MMEGSFPNSFIVGAPKCGTTALASWLADHPQVFMSQPKEPFFFARDYPDLKLQHDLRTIEDYRRLFSAVTPDHSIVMEASTNYLRSNYAIADILSLAPDSRFVALLRDPVHLVHAFHMEQVFGLNEPEPDFERAWGLQHRRAQGLDLEGVLHPGFLQYREVGAIGSQLHRCMEIVPSENLLVLFAQDLRNEPARLFSDVLEFLHLDVIDLPQGGRPNAARRHRSKLLAKIVLDPPRLLRRPIGQTRRVLNSSNSELVSAVKAFLRPPSSRTPISAEFEEQLRRDFAPEVEILETLTSRDLSSWKPKNP